MNRIRLVLATAVFASPTLACGGDGDSGWAGTVQDSAGVRVVSNPQAGTWAEGESWTLTEEYRVGGMDASVEAQFGNVVGIDVDARGNVYVLDGQAREVRVFGPDGSYSTTLGGPGNGPGELSQVALGVFVVGDQVRVPDVGNQRVTVFHVDGSLGEAVRLDLARGIPMRWDELAGERIVAQFRSPAGMGMQGDTIGDPIVSVGAAAADTLAVLPQGATFTMQGGAPRFRFFEAEPVWDAADDGRLITAVNSDYRIEVRDATGQLQHVVKKAFTPRPVTESEQSRMLEAIRGLMVDQGVPPQALDQLLGSASFADEYPALAQILAGPGGSLWVQHIRTADEVAAGGDVNLQDMGDESWDVFDAEGRYLGVVTLPPRFQPLRILGDAFWGVQRDELDVQSVVRLRLHRGD